MTRKSRPSTLAALCAAAFLAAGAAAAQEDKPYRPEGAPAPKAVQVQPGSKDKGEPAIDSPIGCGMVYVAVQNGGSPSATIQNVTCNHGFFLGTVPSSKSASPDQPAVLSFVQSTGWGPDCTITVSKGSATAVLGFQQNYCALKAGSLTASVVSGSATMNGTSQGSFGSGLPGLVWFTVN